MSLNRWLLKCRITDDKFPTLKKKSKCHTCDREVSKIRHDGRRIFGRNVVVGYSLSPLCYSVGEAVPLVKIEKERFPRSFSKEKFMAPLSLLLRTTWTRDPSFWDLLSTSPSIYSTIVILPRTIEPCSYPMVEGEESYDIALRFWPNQ